MKHVHIITSHLRGLYRLHFLKLLANVTDCVWQASELSQHMQRRLKSLQLSSFVFTVT